MNDGKKIGGINPWAVVVALAAIGCFMYHVWYTRWIWDLYKQINNNELLIEILTVRVIVIITPVAILIAAAFKKYPLCLLALMICECANGLLQLRGIFRFSFFDYQDFVGCGVRFSMVFFLVLLLTRILKASNVLICCSAVQVMWVLFNIRQFNVNWPNFLLSFLPAILLLVVVCLIASVESGHEQEISGHMPGS